MCHVICYLNLFHESNLSWAPDKQEDSIAGADQWEQSTQCMMTNRRVARDNLANEGRKQNMRTFKLWKPKDYYKLLYAK